ncbi:MAG: UDP-N-acetylmuramate dehydrogenase [Brevinematales bacterium]|nr:UDP-N-acetylmuramate dehydrogenase [Brevinematales bacterium]
MLPHTVIEKFDVQYNISLKNLTTLRIGGTAKYLVKVYTKKELSKLLDILNSENIPFFLLGGGSNILVRDGIIEDFIILKLDGEFKDIKAINEENGIVRVSIGSAYNLPSVSKFALDNSLEGAEFCVAIPGSVGGGVIMNAGAHGREMKDIIDRISYYTKEGFEKTIRNNEAGFSYRHSNLQEYIISSIEVVLKRGNKEEIKRKIDENLFYRSQNQPKGFSAGSVFKNPPNNKAWKLIREVGLAGYRIGDVLFSEKHANFIINLGNGKAEDVIKLMKLAIRRVKDKFGITLEPEVKLIGLSLDL